MLVYIHIPKNAGYYNENRFSNVILGERYAEFYTRRHGNFLSETEFIELIQQTQPDHDVLCGHDILPLEQECSERLGLKYFTFIRHPVNRAISLYYYEKKLTAGTNHCSQQPFSIYLHERPQENNAISNWQVCNIAGTADYNRAVRLLEQFIMVGVVEHFDRSLLLLSEVIEFPNFNMYYTKDNVSKEKVLSMDTLPQEILDTLLEMNREDVKLFEYATYRLNKMLKQYPQIKYKTMVFKGKNVIRRKAISWVRIL